MGRIIHVSRRGASACNEGIVSLRQSVVQTGSFSDAGVISVTFPIRPICDRIVLALAIDNFVDDTPETTLSALGWRGGFRWSGTQGAASDHVRRNYAIVWRQNSPDRPLTYEIPGEVTDNDDPANWSACLLEYTGILSFENVESSWFSTRTNGGSINTHSSGTMTPSGSAGGLLFGFCMHREQAAVWSDQKINGSADGITVRMNSSHGHMAATYFDKFIPSLSGSHVATAHSSVVGTATPGIAGVGESHIVYMPKATS